MTTLAGARSAHGDGQPDLVRWGQQPGSIYLADQKVPITVPRVRDQAQRREVSLSTYHQLHALADAARPRRGLYRRVLGGLSCREYEAAGEAVPEAFGLARTSVSRRFITFHHGQCARAAPSAGASAGRCVVAGARPRRQDLRGRSTRHRPWRHDHGGEADPRAGVQAHPNSRSW